MSIECRYGGIRISALESINDRVVLRDDEIEMASVALGAESHDADEAAKVPEHPRDDREPRARRYTEVERFVEIDELVLCECRTCTRLPDQQQP